MANEDPGRKTQGREQPHANPDRPRRAVEISGEGNHKPNGRGGEQRPPSPHDQAEDEATRDECCGEDDPLMMPRYAASETARTRDFS